jgi:hypothetical protein
MRALQLLIIAISFLASSLCFASLEPSLSLKEAERSSLRYHLENIFNEVDLTIRNHRANDSDLKRQISEMEMLKVYQRIPLTQDWAGLQADLKRGSKEFNLKWLGIKLIRRSPVPKQIAEEIHFKLKIKGDQDSAVRWVQSWRTAQLRLVETNLKPGPEAVQPLGNQIWQIEGHAFRFRKEYQVVATPRNPRKLLPTWAQKDLGEFSLKEPLLWSLVNRIEVLTPRALPYYAKRREFLLNDARMNFFLSKAMPQ